MKLLYGKNYLTINNYNNNYIKHFIPNSTITLIRCPFEIEDKQLIKGGRLKVISSGRLIKEKSFEVFLKAVAQLKNNTKGKAEFFITGAGNFKRELIEPKTKSKFRYNYQR